MKNIAMCLFLTALLSGCCGNAEMKRVAMGEPILPIHETGDTTEVFLTDYLPSLDLQNIGEVRVTEGYDSLVVKDEVAMLYGAAGKLGVEGKEYEVQDGDIMHFLFNV